MKKGFTLVELLVTFGITTAITVAMMNTLFSIKERSDKTAEFTKISINQSNIIKKIEEDLNKYRVTSILSCGTNCFTFSYEEIDPKELLVNPDTNEISYGDYSKILSDKIIIGSPITISANTIDTIESGINSILKINIPMTNKYNSNDNSINIYYQYNDEELSL